MDDGRTVGMRTEWIVDSRPLCLIECCEIGIAVGISNLISPRVAY